MIYGFSSSTNNAMDQHAYVIRFALRKYSLTTYLCDACLAKTIWDTRVNKTELLLAVLRSRRYRFFTIYEPIIKTCMNPMGTDWVTMDYRNPTYRTRKPLEIVRHVLLASGVPSDVSHLTLLRGRSGE